MLLRDTPDGPAVHMLRRRASMAFAGGAYAYPGGSVDPRDARGADAAGPSAASWAERLGTDEATARAIVCAAVRETFEESGVLLAGSDPDSVVADTTGEDWEADRAALVAHELSFAEFLDRRGLVLRDDLLGAWARWITPEFEARRYDTYFFVAALPEGQRTRNASTEADRTVWVRPQDAAAGYDRGELLMMPPHHRDPAPTGAASDGGRGPGRGRRVRPGTRARPRRPGGRPDRAELARARRVHQEDRSLMTDAAALPGQPRGGAPGGQVSSRAHCVLAPNPSPMTLDGTNTWIVAEPDSPLAVVIDPGPLDDAHLRRVVEAAERGWASGSR